MSSLPLPVVQPSPEGDGNHIVEVAFKGNRVDYFATDDDTLRPGEYVLVDSDRGSDVGRVRSVGGTAARKCSTCGPQKKDGTAAAAPGLRVLRRAEPEEVQRLMVLRSDEERVRRQARELVTRHGLKMKVTEAEWQWDKNKLTLYFTADRRVDFRQLVRDLARTFRTRIELRQIGVRDEAALLGGVGRCGRELCCSTWLREIKPISLQLAKDQNLSLNPAQISGTCGRLMCCLTYEHDAYLAARKRFPREGKLVQTAEGAAKVIGVDIWRDQVTLLDENRQRRTVSLVDLKRESAAASRTGDSGADAAVEPGKAKANAPAPDAAPAAERTDSAEDASQGGGSSSSRRRRRRRRPSAAERTKRQDD